MNPERRRQIEGLYNTALEREPGARQSFLEEACGDVDLRRAVETLLARRETFGDLRDATVTELAAAAHKQGFMSLDEIDRAVLEPGGSISFFGRKPTADSLRHDEVLKRLDRIAVELAALRA